MAKIRLHSFRQTEKVYSVNRLSEKEPVCDFQIPSTAHYATNGLISHNTEITAALVKALGVKVLVLVERQNLLTQTAARLRSYGIKDIGLVGAGHNDPSKPIVIATVQSAEKLENEVLEFQAVICDEVHHAKARTYIKLLKKLKNAHYRWGLSGTLFNDDEEANWFRMAYLGKPIYSIKGIELVEKKVLARPIIQIVEINKPENSVLRDADYQTAYRIGIVENMHRNAIICTLANRLRGKTLVLFKLIDHGEVLFKYMPRALHVDGEKDNLASREKKITGFNRADEAIMVASTIFDEGINFPHIHNLIIASGDKSIIKVIQRMGRGMRMNDTGMVQVFDFFDSTNDILERHSWERLQIYKDEKHEVRLIKS